MDFQSRMAARRAEIVQQERQTKKTSDEALQVQQAAEKQQREEALDKVAEDACRDGVKVIRREEELEFVQQVTVPLDVEGLRRTKLESLLRREARKMWSPFENWMVISLVVAGLFVAIPTAGFGLLLTLGGLVLRGHLNKKYGSVVAARYPEILGPVHAAMKI